MTKHRESTSKYSASLTFRGFNMPPEQVEALIGVKASLMVLHGTTRKPNTRPATRSIVQYEVEFNDTINLFEMVPTLFKYVGGVEHLSKIKTQVSPEFLDVNLCLRIKDSKEQEGGFIDAHTLQEITKLQATLSFEFLGSGDNNG